jgi:hypothetical protein
VNPPGILRSRHERAGNAWALRSRRW